MPSRNINISFFIRIASNFSNNPYLYNVIGGGEVMNVYLVSLALADLLYGVLVVPFSVYPALVQQWVYGKIACRIIGYIEVALWTVSAYTLMWISVDR